MPHALLSVRRRVPVPARDTYLAAWARLRTAAAAAGAHAWAFRSPGDPDLHLEFVEWAAPAAPLLEPAVAAALSALHETFPGTEERWEELEGPTMEDMT